MAHSAEFLKGFEAATRMAVEIVKGAAAEYSRRSSAADDAVERLVNQLVAETFTQTANVFGEMKPEDD
jgi:chemotaxis protein CheY-P-specific phosphatase CheC